ncbi:extracellular solute-binding protein [Thermatribacter velox]|uniref:Extracellular solute-binding protein n=1 Tax=Thermatribacter velox TaxID=3039681 RepID=A0ABZ2YCE7_9BACT
MRRILIVLGVISVMLLVSWGMFACAQTEITIWCHGFDPHRRGFERVASMFMEKNPDIKVTVEPQADIATKIKSALAAGEASDIFTPRGEDIMEMVYTKSILPFPEDIFTVEELKEKCWPEYYLQAPFDKVYAFGIPDPLGDAGIVINLDMLVEAGLEKVDRFTSMEQMLEYAEKLTKRDSRGNVEIAGFSAREYNNQVYFWDFIAEQGGKFYDNDTGLFNYQTEEARKALQFFYDIYYTYRFDSVDLPASFDALAQELAAMAFMWGEYIPFSKMTYPELNFGFAIKPPFFGATEPIVTHVDTWNVAVWSGTKHKDVAFKFVAYMTTPEAQLAFLEENPGISPLKELAKPEYFQDELRSWLLPLLDLLPKAKFWGPFGNDSIIKDSLQRLMSSVIYQEMTVEEALEEMTKQCNEAITNFRKKYPEAPKAKIEW